MLQTQNSNLIAGAQKQSLYLVFYLLWHLFIFNYLILCHRLKEEAGSAGEQPASNKADGDDYPGQRDIYSRCFFFYQRQYGSKNSFSLFYATTPFWYPCPVIKTALILLNNFLAMRIMASLPFIFFNNSW